MALIPESIIAEVIQRSNIVEVINSYVPLKKSGNASWKACCPCHQEKTPSFHVSESKQLYYCFGCGASGNVISFVMQAENCDFAEAVEKLAQKAHIKLPEPEFSEEMKQEENLKNRLRDMHSAAGRFYYDILQTDEGVKAKDYLDKNESYEQWNFKRDGASRISRLLFEEATDINFYVGRAINPAHQNPDLPINFSIKMNLVEELSACLRQMGKRIKVSYF